MFVNRTCSIGHREVLTRERTPSNRVSTEFAIDIFGYFPPVNVGILAEHRSYEGG